jgi:hypothetical protein
MEPSRKLIAKQGAKKAIFPHFQADFQVVLSALKPTFSRN